MPQRVSDVLRQDKINQDRVIYLYNPDTEDFTCKFEGKEHISHAMRREEFPYYVGKHIQKHLAMHLLNTRSRVKNPAEDYANILKEIIYD